MAMAVAGAMALVMALAMSGVMALKKDRSCLI